MDLLIPFAINKLTGKSVTAGQVESGLACGCVCPSCGADLESCHMKKFGNSYFRHSKKSYTKRECKYALDFSIHRMAEQLLKEGMDIVLPAMEYCPGNKCDPLIVSEERVFHITKVEIEHRLRNIIPDLVLYSGEEKIFLEIFVTHKVDKAKIDKLVEYDTPTLEIDLSYYNFIENPMTEEILSEILVRTDHKEWKYRNKEIYYLEQKVRKAERLRYVRLTHGFDVINCPLNETSRNFSNENCENCPYCLSIGYQEIICSGRAGFSFNNRNLKNDEIRAIINSQKKEKQIKKDEEIKANREIKKNIVKYTGYENKQNKDKIEPKPQYDSNGKRIYTCVYCGKNFGIEMVIKANVEYCICKGCAAKYGLNSLV